MGGLVLISDKMGVLYSLMVHGGVLSEVIAKKKKLCFCL